MSLIKTAGAPPIFLSPSAINGDTYTAGNTVDGSTTPGGIVTGTMQALAHRLYQMDPSAMWMGSGGAATEYITITFYSGVAAVQRVIDSILILNNNLNNFVLEYSTDSGSNWTAIDTVTGNGGLDYVKFLDSPITIPATTGRLRLTMTTTSPGAQNKFVGNLIATQSLFQPTNPPSEFTDKPEQTMKAVTMVDGTKDRTYFFWSDNTCVLKRLNFKFKLMPLADKLNFDALFASALPFLCYPEPGDNARNIYLCVFEPTSYNPSYSSQFKGAGYELPMILDQAGYL